jgi:hypothetical protein
MGTGIESVTVPDSVEEFIGFDESARLAYVRFGAGSRLLKLIGFSRCPLLTSIAVPDSVLVIAGFNRAPLLREVHFGASSHLVKISGFNDTAIECMDLPDSVEIIEERLLSRNNGPPAVLRVGNRSRLKSQPCGRGPFIIAEPSFLSKRRRALHLAQCRPADSQSV